MSRFPSLFFKFIMQVCVIQRISMHFRRENFCTARQRHSEKLGGGAVFRNFLAANAMLWKANYMNTLQQSFSTSLYKLQVHTRRKARRVRTVAGRPKFALTPHSVRCRAFYGILRSFLVHYVDKRYLMPFYAFRKGKLHACNARQRRSPPGKCT